MAIQLKTPQDLDNIRNDLTATYELANDIDMADFGNWTPIRNFDGIFDGKGHVIKNLKIDGNSGDDRFFGFFGNTYTGSPVRNVGLENIDVDVTQQDEVGGLIGASNGDVTNCYVTGKVVGTGKYVGGLIGSIDDKTVKNCYVDVNVDAFSAGGLFGGNSADSLVTIKNNYAVGTVTGYYADVKSGFMGNVGSSFTPTFENNHFDSDVLGSTVGSRTGVTANTTKEMKTKSTFTNWDFTNTWTINDGNEYPKLQVILNARPANKATKDVTSYTGKFVSNITAKYPEIKDISVTSYINKIDSNANILAPQSKDISVTSYVSPITSNTDRYATTEYTLTSYMSEIQSNATQSSIKPKTINVTSYVNKIISNAETSKKETEFREVTGYTGKIISNAVSIYPVSKTIDVNGYIKPIQSNVDITSTSPIFAERIVSSHVKAIQGLVTTDTYVKYIPVFATSYIIENMSNAYHVDNPSNVEVIK